jgi:hypothetical protein
MFDWFWEFLFQIAQWILRLIDGIYKIFLVLAGAAPASVQQDVTGGSTGNILETLFENTTVQYVFWAFMVISFFVFFVAIIVGIAKSEFSGQDNKEPKIKLFRRAITSFATILALPVIFALAIWATSFLLGAIVEVMGGTNFTESNLSQKIFEICLPTAHSFPDTQIVWDDKVADIMRYYTLSQYNYVIAYIGGGIILVILGVAVLTLVERLINIILLYITAPFILATSVLDDGQRFGVWRDLVISKLLGVGGMILSLYLYFILLGVVQDFFVSTSFLSQLAYLLFAIGGALAATKGGMIIANLVGHNTAMIEGQQQAQTAHLLDTGLRNSLRVLAGTAKVGTRLIARGAGGLMHAINNGANAAGAVGSAASGVGAIESAGNATGSMINQAMQSSTTLAAQVPGFQQQQAQQSGGMGAAVPPSNGTPSMSVNQQINANGRLSAPPNTTLQQSQQQTLVQQQMPPIAESKPMQGEGGLSNALKQNDKNLGGKK